MLPGLTSGTVIWTVASVMGMLDARGCSVGVTEYLFVKNRQRKRIIILLTAVEVLAAVIAVEVAEQNGNLLVGDVDATGILPVDLLDGAYRPLHPSGRECDDGVDNSGRRGRHRGEEAAESGEHGRDSDGDHDEKR